MSFNISDTLAIAGETHNYAVSAKNGCGEGPKSDTDPGTRLAMPPAITTIVASDTNCTYVRITWNNVAGEDSFVVFRGATNLGKTLANDTAFTDNTATPDTIYTYTVLAYNRCGARPAITSDTGKRRAAPLAPLTLTASENSCDSILVTWTATANVDTFLVYRDDAPIASVLGVVQFYVDRTAAAGPWYHYYVKSKNPCGLSVASVADSGRRAIAPSIPDGRSASVTSCTGIDLNWLPSTGEFTAYAIKRDGVVLTLSVSKDSTHFKDTTATAGSHYYRMAAVNALCGDPAFSSDSTHGLRLGFPGVPTNLSATHARCDSIVLTWTPAPGAYDSCQIFVSDSVLLATVGATVVRYAYQPPVGAYVYKIRTTSAACGSSAFTDTSSGARLLTPSAPSNFAVSVNRCDGIHLSWTASQGAIAKYNIYRDTAFLDSVDATVTEKLDTSATIGNHQYYVVAHSALCNSDSATATLIGTRLAYPTAPAGVTATDTSCVAVFVKWHPSSGTVHEYRVFRDGVLQTPSVVPPDTHYVDISAAPNVFYRYTVAAYDSVCGQSDTTGATGKRLGGAATPANFVATGGCFCVALHWNPSSEAESYKIYRDSVLSPRSPTPPTVIPRPFRRTPTITMQRPTIPAAA